MAFLRFSTLALLSLSAIATIAQADKPIIESPAAASPSSSSSAAAPLPASSSNPAIKISTTFPHAEVFGIKLINGHPTQAVLTIANSEKQAVSVAFVTGNLFESDALSGAEKLVRNLTATPYKVRIAAGANETVVYNFKTELHPQDLRLVLTALLTSATGAIYTLPAFEGPVSIVEPDASIFDPQLIFLYLVLAGLFSGTCYFIYNTWVATLFPPKPRGGKGSERAKRSSLGSKKVDAADQVSVAGAGAGADGLAVASGAKAYDESWIPAHHLNRPEARRVKSGAGSGRSKSRGKAE